MQQSMLYVCTGNGYNKVFIKLIHFLEENKDGEPGAQCREPCDLGSIPSLCITYWLSDVIYVKEDDLIVCQ